MDNARLAAPYRFCWNANCRACGMVDGGTIGKFGRTEAGTQRYQCTIYRRTFVETIGTVFYGRHWSRNTPIECLALLAECNSLVGLHGHL